MKHRLQTQILLATILLGLLFSQVGAGFFHNKHEAHKGTMILAQGHYAVQEHGEHCKLCAIDLIQLFHESYTVSVASTKCNSTFVLPIFSVSSTFHSFLKGRAPPVC